MDEKLKVPNFDAVSWLNANLDINRSDALETQLTELTFNLQNYQTELESKILASKEDMETFVFGLDAELENLGDEYNYVNQYIKMNFGELELQKLQMNEALFTEINEKNIYRTRINNILNTLDQIISLEFHIQEIKKSIEANDIFTLEKKVVQIQKGLTIILKLPLIHPLHEKIEALMDLLNEKLYGFLLQKIKADDTKLNVSTLPIYKVYSILNNEAKFLQVYEEKRVVPKANYFVDEIDSMNSIRDVTQIIVRDFKGEIEYMRELIQGKSTKFVVQALRCFAGRTLPIFIENIFNPQYLNAPQDAVVEVFSDYISFIVQIEEALDSLNYDNDDEWNQLFSILYQPIIQNRRKIVANELKYLEGEMSSITSDLQFRESPSDQLSSFHFTANVDILWESFSRVLDVTLGLEVEEWTVAVQGMLEEYLDRFDEILEQTEYSMLRNSLLDKLLSTSENKVGGASGKMKEKIQAPEKMDFNFSQFLTLLDVLIKKFEDFLIFEEKINRLDFKIRNSLLDNTFSMKDIRPLIIKIQGFFYKTDDVDSENRRKLLLAIQNGYILFDSFFKRIKSTQDKIKRVILKILIGDCYNKLVDISKNPVWNYKVAPEDERKSSSSTLNPTEYVLQLSQSFFIHLQMLEEMMSGREKALQIQENEFNVPDLYTKKLEVELQNESFSFEKKTESGEKLNLVKYWAFQFSNNLLRIYRAFLETIDQCSYHGLQQIKTDIEYLLNVLQSFRFMGKVKEFESLLQVIQSSKPSDIVKLKDIL